jgi:hypothetical protein
VADGEIPDEPPTMPGKAARNLFAIFLGYNDEKKAIFFYTEA